ncbi:hypothetical protein [Pantoea agglomerans]
MKKENKVEKITLALTESQIQHLESLKERGDHKTITKVIYDLIDKSRIFDN